MNLEVLVEVLQSLLLPEARPKHFHDVKSEQPLTLFALTGEYLQSREEVDGEAFGC